MNTHGYEIGYRQWGIYRVTFAILLPWEAYFTKGYGSKHTIHLAAASTLCSSLTFLCWLGQVWSRNGGISKPVFSVHFLPSEGKKKLYNLFTSSFSKGLTQHLKYCIFIIFLFLLFFQRKISRHFSEDVFLKDSRGWLLIGIPQLSLPGFLSPQLSLAAIQTKIRSSVP